MQRFLFSITSMFLVASNLFAQQNYVEPRHCNISYDLVEVTFDRATRISTYTLDGKPYTGCVEQDVPSNKIYYLHYVKNGKLERQIGYYYNGQKCRDFHFKDGVEHGTLELFYTNGSHYIYEEYKDGQLHGDVKRWRRGQLARTAKFWYGSKISEQIDEAALEQDLTEEEKRLGGTNC